MWFPKHRYSSAPLHHYATFETTVVRFWTQETHTLYALSHFSNIFTCISITSPLCWISHNRCGSPWYSPFGLKPPKSPTDQIDILFSCRVVTKQTPVVQHFKVYQHACLFTLRDQLCWPIQVVAPLDATISMNQPSRSLHDRTMYWMFCQVVSVFSLVCPEETDLFHEWSP